MNSKVSILSLVRLLVRSGRRKQGNEGRKQITAKEWAKALNNAMDSLAKYTPAKPGDRTLVDALAPFVEQLNATGDVQKAAQAADEGSKKTKGIAPSTSLNSTS